MDIKTQLETSRELKLKKESGMQAVRNIDKLLGDPRINKISKTRKNLKERKGKKLELSLLKNKVYILNREIKNKETLLSTKKNKIKDSHFGKVTITIEEAIKKGVPDKLCTLISLKVGAEEYISLTHENTEKHIKNLLQNAKEGGLNQLDIQLRKFGYIYEYENLKTSQNEVLGLVEQEILIEKRKSTLNSDILSTDNFALCSILNEHNEFIIGIEVLKLKLIEKEIELLIDQIKLNQNKVKRIPFKLSEIKEKITSLDESISFNKKEIKNIRENKFKEKQLNEQLVSWENLLIDLNVKRFEIISKKSFLREEEKIFSIDLGGIIEIKYPEKLEGTFQLRKEILLKWIKPDEKEIFENFIIKFNKKTYEIENEFKKNIKEYNIVLLEVQNQVEKYRNSSFGFGFSKLKKLEKQLDTINNNMNKNRNSALQNLIKNSILDNKRAYYSLQVEEYNNLLDKAEMNPKSFIIT